jgi:hypothetical protein
MPDPESQFLDALYLSVRDLTEFDQALTILCGLFDVGSAALIDFDAARPEVATQAAIGLFSGGVAAHYEREFAHLDPTTRVHEAPTGHRHPDLSPSAGREASARHILQRVLPAART